MNNQLAIFNFKSTPVRTQIIDNNIWFCLIDVCDSLKLCRGSKVVDRLDEAGVRKTSLSYTSGAKEVSFINEPNLYRLIFRSNKPAAVQFGNWVYEEVLPSIRKTGGYGTPAQLDAKAIGGIVKKCCAVAVREELANLLAGDKTENWECSDQDLIYWLYRWHNTKSKAETLVFRQLHAERDALMAEITQLKEKAQQIKQLAIKL